MDQQRDGGFSLVEIIVSITLLGLLFAVSAPLFAGALLLTSNSTIQATASEIANSQLEAARTHATSCTNLKSFLSTPITGTVTDARGITYTVTQTPTTAISCPASTLLPYYVEVSTNTSGVQPKVRIETAFWTGG